MAGKSAQQFLEALASPAAAPGPRLEDVGCDTASHLRMRCVSANGVVGWQGYGDRVETDDRRFPPSSCGADSLPWRAQLLCRADAGPKQCFLTTIGASGQKGVVCVESKDGAPLRLSATGLVSFGDVHPRSDGDTKIVPDDAVFSHVQPCLVQTFSDLASARSHDRDAPSSAMTLYVQKGEEELCRSVQAEAREACAKGVGPRKAGECAARVLDAYEDVTTENTFRCVMDTSRVPRVRPWKPGKHWYDWARVNEDVTCHTREDCRPYAGVCDRDAASGQGICTAGSGVGGRIRCETDEDCDTMTPSCEGGACDGDTTVRSAYVVPTPCQLPDAESQTRYTYCGADEAGVFTGYCAPYKHRNQTFLGCRPFEGEAQRAKLIEVEVARRGTQDNFFDRASQPDYLRTRVCEATDADTLQVGGRVRVCRHTTSRLEVADRLVKAQTEDEAVDACNALLPGSNRVFGTAVFDSKIGGSPSFLPFAPARPEEEPLRCNCPSSCPPPEEEEELDTEPDLKALPEPPAPTPTPTRNADSFGDRLTAGLELRA